MFRYFNLNWLNLTLYQNQATFYLFINLIQQNTRIQITAIDSFFSPNFPKIINDVGYHYNNSITLFFMQVLISVITLNFDFQNKLGV